jgi:hypothetical protein
MVIYRKQGEVVRWENGALVRVSECGVAVERPDSFECHPDVGAARPALPVRVDEVLDAAAAVRALVPASLHIERLLLTCGAAIHEYGPRVWAERARRLHLSLVRGATRALIDAATFDLALVRAVASALERHAGGERERPASLRLAPNVTAALLPHLVGGPLEGARIIQAAGGVDGRGEPVAAAVGEWPNWYRPSYRVRPLRAPMNIRLEGGGTDLDPAAPLAVALVAPIEGRTARLLVDDGREAYVATAHVTAVRGVGAARTWYPYGAGSFGAELML